MWGDKNTLLTICFFFFYVPFLSVVSLGNAAVFRLLRTYIRMFLEPQILTSTPAISLSDTRTLTAISSMHLLGTRYDAKKSGNVFRMFAMYLADDNVGAFPFRWFPHRSKNMLPSADNIFVRHATDLQLEMRHRPAPCSYLIYLSCASP